MREGQASFYRFGPYRLYTPDLLLVCRGTPVHLTPKALETLLVLVRNQGRMVSKGELLEEVWPGTFVDEGILAHNVCEIRRALGSNGSDGEFYVQTIPRRGYRFAPEVEYCEATPKVKSVAVLPFRGVGLSEHDDWLRFGLADAITTRLANVRELAVRPTSAAARCAGQNHDSFSAGKELATTSVLEGVLRKSGNDLRLTLQLVDVGSRRTVWGGQFDERAGQLLLLEDHAAEQVVAALPVTLAGSEWQRVRKRHTENPEAYNLRLQARRCFYRPAPQVLHKSIGLLRQALEQDPHYALAYCDLSLCYQMLAMFAAARPAEVVPPARTAAERALKIDDGLADARAALAFAQWHYDFQWTEAERQLQAVLELTPNDARMHTVYGMLLGETGRFGASLRELGRALELEPNFAFVHASKAMVLGFARRFEDAIKSCRRALLLDPECFRAHWMAGVMHAQRENFRAAIQHLRRAAELSGNNPAALAGLVHAYAGAGSRKAAIETLRQLEQVGRERYVSAGEMAVAYAGLGETELAFKALSRALEEHSISLVLSKVDPQLDALRPDPRFREVLRRIGLEPAVGVQASGR